MGHNIMHTIYKDILVFKPNVHQIKLFFHGSRITVLSCTVLRLKSKEIESSYFFTEAVQPVYFRLITENIDYLKRDFFSFDFSRKLCKDDWKFYAAFRQADKEEGTSSKFFTSNCASEESFSADN